MHNIELTIKVPELTDEAAAMLQEFIYGFMDAFDEQYHKQIEKYYGDASCQDPTENQAPF